MVSIMVGVSRWCARLHLCVFGSQRGVRKPRPWTCFAPTIQQPEFLLEATYGHSRRKWNPNFNTSLRQVLGEAGGKAWIWLMGFKCVLIFFFGRKETVSCFLFFFFFFPPKPSCGWSFGFVWSCKSWPLCFTLIAICHVMRVEDGYNSG